MKGKFFIVIICGILLGCGEKKCNIEQGSDVEKLLFNVGGVEFSLVRVEPGTFVMGDNGNFFRKPAIGSKPAHKVTISKAFYIGQTEVTQELYAEVMGDNPSNYYECPNLPVEHVSYNNAVAFCKRISAILGKTFTLPTEAQWEYASLDGNLGLNKKKKFSGCNDIDDVGWYFGNSEFKTHEVAMKKPNKLGVYDMTGNVCEWCLDTYDIYPDKELVDPCVLTSSKSNVYRGGAWLFKDKMCQIKQRYMDEPNFKSDYLGFRIVMIP